MGCWEIEEAAWAEEVVYFELSSQKSLKPSLPSTCRRLARFKPFEAVLPGTRALLQWQHLAGPETGGPRRKKAAQAEERRRALLLRMRHGLCSGLSTGPASLPPLTWRRASPIFTIDWNARSSLVPTQSNRLKNPRYPECQRMSLEGV